MNFLLDEVVQAIAIQSAGNNPSLVASNYYKYLSNALPSQIPGNESVTDESMVGDGFSRVERNVFNYYWKMKELSISGLLNDHIAAILMNAWQGGAVTTTARTGGSKDISSVMNVSNSIPKLLAIFRKLGGERFIHSTLIPNNFSIQQEGEQQPTFNFDLLNTGHFVDSDALDTATFNESAIVDVPDYEYFHGAATSVIATDGVENYNWTQDGDLMSLSIEGSNGAQVARRPGDSFYVSGDRRSGAIARKYANSKTTGAIKLKVDLKSTLREFKTMIQNKKLTGLTFIFGGFNKIGSTNDYFEFEIKAPSSQFDMIEGDSDQDYGALSLNIRPLRDAVTKGRYTTRVRTNKTLI